MAVPWFVILVLTATALGASVTPEKQVLERSTCGRVWLTVHSPEIKRTNRSNIVDALELNWDFNECSNFPKVIGLFDARPSSWRSVLVTHRIRSHAGHFVTNRTLGDIKLPAGWQTQGGQKGPHCLWPWIAAGDEYIHAYNCLKIQPTWMEDNYEAISHLTIGELVIPGTHNAGAWRFNTEISSLARDSFVLCQDRSVWAQLVHGIRYLDFRIAYYEFYPKEEDRYWLNHNLIRVRPLVPLLREIRTFLDTTSEIVFLDAHHFPMGFYSTDGSAIADVHQGLLKLIQRELGPHLAHANQLMGHGHKGPSLKTLVEADKRLLFSYADSSIVSGNSWLWPPLPHLWANTNVPADLFLFLDEAITMSYILNSPNPLSSAMAQTTPTVLDILFLRGSLRENADAVNRNVTMRLKTTWRQHANIVSTDFFLGNDVTDVSIALNLERAKKL